MNKHTLREAYRLASLAARPLVFGHRGAMAYAPQNTLPAFQLALDQAADGIELDVQLSADGHLIVIHDDTVDATTDGSGLVSAMDANSLRKLDAGAWHGPQFAGTRLPILDEVFERFGRSLYINVELKYPDRHLARLASLGPAELAAEAWMDLVSPLAEKTIACIRSHRLVERVIVSSFNPLALRLMARLAPEIAIGFLWAPDLPVDTPALMRDTPYQAWHPEWHSISEQVLDQEHGQNHWVNGWTVNDPDAALALAALGVDGIITNDPAAIISALYRNPR